jgi:hypothetical protein
MQEQIASFFFKVNFLLLCKQKRKSQEKLLKKTKKEEEKDGLSLNFMGATWVIDVEKFLRLRTTENLLFLTLPYIYISPCISPIKRKNEDKEEEY